MIGFTTRTRVFANEVSEPRVEDPRIRRAALSCICPTQGAALLRSRGFFTIKGDLILETRKKEINSHCILLAVCRLRDLHSFDDFWYAHINRDITHAKF